MQPESHIGIRGQRAGALAPSQKPNRSVNKRTKLGVTELQFSSLCLFLFVSCPAAPRRSTWPFHSLSFPPALPKPPSFFSPVVVFFFHSQTSLNHRLLFTCCQSLTLSTNIIDRGWSPGRCVVLGSPGKFHLRPVKKCFPALLLQHGSRSLIVLV